MLFMMLNVPSTASSDFWWVLNRCLNFFCLDNTGSNWLCAGDEAHKAVGDVLVPPRIEISSSSEEAMTRTEAEEEVAWLAQVHWHLHLLPGGIEANSKMKGEWKYRSIFKSVECVWETGGGCDARRWTQFSRTHWVSQRWTSQTYHNFMTNDTKKMEIILVNTHRYPQRYPLITKWNPDPWKFAYVLDPDLWVMWPMGFPMILPTATHELPILMLCLMGHLPCFYW